MWSDLHIHTHSGVRERGRGAMRVNHVQMRSRRIHSTQHQRCTYVSLVPTTTNIRLTTFFQDNLGKPAAGKVNHSGFYWSKRWWVAVASAGPYAIICITLQTDNHASTPSLNFLWDGCSSWRPTNSVNHCEYMYSIAYVFTFLDWQCPIITAAVCDAKRRYCRCLEP